jgi:hypothetical protein
MKVGFLSLALTIVVFASAPGGFAVVQAQQTRNQTQSQQGLPPKQKQDLTRMGPEDIFGVSSDDSRKSGTTARQRRTQPTPAAPSSPPPRQSTTSAATQPPATQPTVQPSVAAPSPTIPAAGAIDSGGSQSPLSQEVSSDKIPSKWMATILILMALIVSGALIFTLSKLVEKIREGSSG